MKRLLILIAVALGAALVGLWFWFGAAQPARLVVAPHVQPFLSAVAAQHGVVTSYDNGYYAGGYPPEGTGACTDVVSDAMRQIDMDWKARIDTDMRTHPDRYATEYDTNINFRRVRNVQDFLTHHAENLPHDADFQPGDIVTYDQIPGSLWHIAVVSDRQNRNGTPFIWHNFGRGTQENAWLHTWPAPMIGHYRLPASFFSTGA